MTPQSIDQEKRKKIIWLVIGGAFLFYMMGGFARFFPHPVRRPPPNPAQQGRGRGPNAPGRQGGQPGTPMGGPGGPGAPPPFAIKLAGHWEGQSMIATRGMCTLKLEIRRRPDAQFAGFSNLACTSMSLLTPHKSAPPANPLFTLMSPDSAVMSGVVGGGKIHFTIDQLISSTNTCPMTAFTVTPFGADRIAAQWTETGCPGGQMMLERPH